MHGKSYLPSHKVLFWGAIRPFARAYEMAYVNWLSDMAARLMCR